MLTEKMYVRCPADKSNKTDPRVFVCGQIIAIDDFKKTVRVIVHDPFGLSAFFEDIAVGEQEFPQSSVEHCSLFDGSAILYKKELFHIISHRQTKEEFYVYWLQSDSDKRIIRLSEKNIIASFTNGCVDPASQLKSYEFQNPSWFMGHEIVSRSMNVLENSIYGFKELAGSKIYLFPHQVNTIMRCLQENPCRYMLADEVGMGKTIEAISVLKILMQNRANSRALILAPKALVEQWKTELLIKFNISVGVDQNQNLISVKAIEDISSADAIERWSILIVDEIHRVLYNKQQYERIHSLSSLADNVLLLSATPVQQRKEEYLKLLRLLQPMHYDSCSLESFSTLVDKQSHIIQRTAMVLDDLGDYQDEIASTQEENEDPHDSEDCEDLFEDITASLEKICRDLMDEKLTGLLKKISFDDEDLGVYQIKTVISYICGNYQLENNIIRNRRRILENSEDGTRVMPIRTLDTHSYEMNRDQNPYEAACYEQLSEWIRRNSAAIDVFDTVRPLLGAFFSSPWAFFAQASKVKGADSDFKQILETAQMWMKNEKYYLQHIREIIDDPDSIPEAHGTRLVTVLTFLYDELYDQKTVLFTNEPETFKVYRTAIEAIFPPKVISFFGAGMTPDELEVNAFRFQTEAECKIMLCDSTGGEGRNFQCADHILHIDLPWDASLIEQRIGRLDRLERDPARPEVNSIVVYAEDTFEEALFFFWNNGLKIFTQSLSGMEIIMNDINAAIADAVKEDFKTGLFNRVPIIVQQTESMREAVRKEQQYDAAGFMFRPMFIELKRLIDYYSRYENELFASAMTGWARLAGFRGFGNANGIITYSPASFSPASAINSQLIPPNWKEYLQNGQQRRIDRVLETINRASAKKTQSGSIQGTFIRKLAIENDYLHFFAPGDEIFECIINNAINSCKGRCSAFAVASSVEWKGIVFTWSLAPNSSLLMEKGVSSYALGPYRGYLSAEQLIVPIGLDNPEDLNEETVVREFLRVINHQFHKRNMVHLGKRTHSPGFLGDMVSGESNVQWFKSCYPADQWASIVDDAREQAYKQAFNTFKHRSNVRGAREEMERVLSARAANSTYFELTDEAVEKLQEEQSVLMDAIRHPVVSLDSAAFVWMVKTEDGLE